MKDYLNGDESGYGSHIPVLQFIFEHIQIRNTIELGCGNFSTPFLIDNCKRVLSIEQSDFNWFKKINSKYINDPGWVGVYSENPMYLSNVDLDFYDFALIDGAGYTRVNCCAYCMFKKMDTILIHDSENSWYGYATLDDLAKRLRYFDFAFEQYHPQSRLFTKNEKLIAACKLLNIS